MGRERCRVHKKENLHIMGQHDTDTIEKWTMRTELDSARNGSIDIAHSFQLLLSIAHKLSNEINCSDLSSSVLCHPILHNPAQAWSFLRVSCPPHPMFCFTLCYSNASYCDKINAFPPRELYFFFLLPTLMFHLVTWQRFRETGRP